MFSHIYNHKVSMTYDPASHGISSGLFAPIVTSTITGANAITSEKLVMNNSGFATYGCYNKEIDVTFYMNVPVAPVAGQNKYFGMKSISLGNLGSIGFSIVDDELIASVYNDAGALQPVYDAVGGTLIASNVITWDAGWHTNEIAFRIRVAGKRVYFYINGDLVAVTAELTTLNRLGLPITAYNVNADAMAMGPMPIINGASA